MTTLHTRYHGPTNRNPSRISVRGYSHREGRELTRRYPFDYAERDAHDAAVLRWMAEEGEGETCRLVRGETPDGRGWVYVDADFNHSVTVPGRKGV